MSRKLPYVLRSLRALQEKLDPKQAQALGLQIEKLEEIDREDSWSRASYDSEDLG